MVGTFGSGAEDFASISSIGISYSTLPTWCGPEYAGSLGIGLKRESIEALAGAWCARQLQDDATKEAKGL